MRIYVVFGSDKQEVDVPDGHNFDEFLVKVRKLFELGDYKVTLHIGAKDHPEIEFDLAELVVAKVSPDDVVYLGVTGSRTTSAQSMESASFECASTPSITPPPNQSAGGELEFGLVFMREKASNAICNGKFILENHVMPFIAGVTMALSSFKYIGDRDSIDSVKSDQNATRAVACLDYLTASGNDVEIRLTLRVITNKGSYHLPRGFHSNPEICLLNKNNYEEVLHRLTIELRELLEGHKSPLIRLLFQDGVQLAIKLCKMLNYKDITHLTMTCRYIYRRRKTPTFDAIWQHLYEKLERQFSNCLLKIECLAAESEPYHETLSYEENFIRLVADRRLRDVKREKTSLQDRIAQLVRENHDYRLYHLRNNAHNNGEENGAEDGGAEANDMEDDAAEEDDGGRDQAAAQEDPIDPGQEIGQNEEGPGGPIRQPPQHIRRGRRGQRFGRRGFPW